MEKLPDNKLYKNKTDLVPRERSRENTSQNLQSSIFDFKKNVLSGLDLSTENSMDVNSRINVGQMRQSSNVFINR